MRNDHDDRGPRAARTVSTSAPRHAVLALAALALTAGMPCAARAVTDPWLDPSRVLVIYNTSWPDGDADGTPDSTEVAQYYALRRGVPADRLLGLPLSPSSWSYAPAQWPAFLAELRDPLLAWLAAHGDTSVDTLLFCYGVPYEVDVPGFSFGGARSVDSSLCVPYTLGTAAAPGFSDNKFNDPYREPSPHVPPDAGHFDHALYDFQGTPCFLHARLDGLSAEHAKALVDRALYGQAHVSTAPGGYGGAGYVDSRFALYSDAALTTGYPFGYTTYEAGDKSMAHGKLFVEQSGFPLRWEPHETEIGEPGALFTDGASAEFAADALFYGGWYNFAKYQHAWQWKAGSFACDLNSNSAQGLRDAGTVSFLCQAFQENLTAGAGVIAEPFLNGHNRPDVFLAYVLDGFPWAEASMLSDNAVKWMGLHVGDPLHRIDLAHAVPDLAPPAPVAWLAPAHDALEFELPAVPGELPGGEEVFRVTALASGAAPAVAPAAVMQPDDRRLQLVAVPSTGTGGLTYAQAAFADPAGNAGLSALLHFVAGPAQPATAVVQAENVAPATGDPVVFRFAFGAAGGLLAGVTSFSMTITAPAYGVSELPASGALLSLASGYLVSRSIDQVDFLVAFAPGALRPGPFTVAVSLGANAQVATGSATVLVTD
ncbi:MAG TPA: TIGR03790 family protein [Planctomycetota bacterium]|nr:TIGR03790 family protein [Planctomycetota bacterium]